MSDLTTSWGDTLTVDRDYLDFNGEDVALQVFASEDSAVTLTPDEARELARLLIHHADEVDDINKEADRA